MPDSEPAWTVLLVGGASGAGKSRLSHPLARRLGVNLTEVDDFQVVLESSTTPEQQPVLHFWRTHWDEFSSWTDEQRRDHFIRVCREVFQPALVAVIADHLLTGTRVVLEGDFVLPELATMDAFGDQPNGGRVRAIFVSEHDEQQIATNLTGRDGELQSGRVRASVLLDGWLRAECGRHGIAVVPARPWDTAVDRALAILGTMPDDPPNDAKETLHRYLKVGREALLWKLDGLSEYDIRQPLTPTATNLLGLVKHVATVELGYFTGVFGRPHSEVLPWDTEEAEMNADMWATQDESRDDIVGLYRRVWEYSDATIDALDLDSPGVVPWWSEARRNVTLHTILVHMLAETHRHLGHADICREQIDGGVGHRQEMDNMPPVERDWWQDYFSRVQGAANFFGATQQ